MKYLILIMMLLSGCGNVHTLHDYIDCALTGDDCPVSADEFERYKEEQDIKLQGIDAQIAEAMVILNRDRLDITEVVNLCGNNKEILIRIDGELIAFHSGRGGYLDILGPGRYITTDGKACRFTINNDMEVVY